MKCSLNRSLLRHSIVALCLLASASAQDWIDGLSEPQQDSTLGFQLAGVLASLSVKDGQAVKEGDLLASLDNELEKLEVARRALVRDAAQKDYERTKQVFDNGKSVSRDELDQKEANFKVAEVEHQVAEAQLRRRQLRAPFDGIISDHFDLDPGESVQPNAPVVRLVNPALCRFTCHVPGSVNHGLKEGTSVTIQFQLGEKTVNFAGKVEFVSPTVDAASGLQVIKATFANPERAIAPGITGKLQIKTS